MPQYVKALLLPANGGRWPIVEDKYVIGGLRVVASIEERDAIYQNADMRPGLKIGSIVVVSTDGTAWRHLGSNTWVAWPGPVGSNSGYVHVQAENSLTWEVRHNRNASYYMVQTYVGGKQVMPSEVETLDLNNVRITFAVPVSGHACFNFMEI